MHSCKWLLERFYFNIESDSLFVEKHAGATYAKHTHTHKDTFWHSICLGFPRPIQRRHAAVFSAATMHAIALCAPSSPRENIQASVFIYTCKKYERGRLLFSPTPHVETH